MKTKLLPFMIITIVLAIILVGNTSNKDIESSESVTITFWERFGGAMGDFFEDEAELFHEEYPWITVEVSHYPDQNAYLEILGIAFESGNAPDTFIRRHPFSQLIKNGWIQPLDRWITPEWIAKFPEGSFAETINIWEDKIYSFPTYNFKLDLMLYINEELFKKAGLLDTSGNILLPQTWSDLRSMTKKITQAGNGDFYGIGIGIKDARYMGWWFYFASLAGAGGGFEIDYRKGCYTYGTDPAYSQIVQMLLGMKADGSVYPYESTLDDSNLYSFFAQNKFAIFLSGSWVINNLARDFPDFKNYRVISVPEPDEGRKGGFPVWPGSGTYFMSSQSQNPDAAWLWLDWISSRGFHERMVTKGLDFSVYNDLNTPQNIKDPHKIQAFDASTRYIVFGPFPPARNSLTALIQPEPVLPSVGDLLVGIYTGQIDDWQQALIELDERKQTALLAAIQEARKKGLQVSIEDYIFSDWNPLENYVFSSE